MIPQTTPVWRPYDTHKDRKIVDSTFLQADEQAESNGGWARKNAYSTGVWLDRFGAKTQKLDWFREQRASLAKFLLI